MAVIIDNSDSYPPVPPVNQIPLRQNSCISPKRELELQKRNIHFTKNDKTTNDIIIFLDKSGSMESLGEEPAQACKGFIQLQYDTAMAEQDPVLQTKLLNVRIKLITFSETYQTVIDAPVHELNNTTFVYKPSGMTDLYSPLYDIFSTNNTTPKDMVIISDGQNNSGPHNSSYIKRQIQNAINAGWTLKFIGCTVDSMAETEKLGVQQFTSDCSVSNELEGASAPTMTVLLRCHSKQVSDTNRMRAGGEPEYETDEEYDA